jgi:hypothetical protein
MKPNGSLEVETGLGLDVDDLAEAQHDRLLALVDDEDRREQAGTGDDDRAAMNGRRLPISCFLP